MNKLLLTTLTASALWLGACSDSSSSTDGDGSARAAQLTDDTVHTLLSGDDDFESQQSDLGLAVTLDPSNVEARVFLAAVTALHKVQQEMQQDQNTYRLLERAGIRIRAGQTFWDAVLELEDHGQGLFKDSTPTLDEIAMWIEGSLIPTLDALVVALESVPADWEYIVPAQHGGRLLAFLSPGGNHQLRFDYADAQTAAAVGHLLIGALQTFLVLDWDDLAPNDFDFVENPAVDLLDLLETRYPNCGTLLRTQLLTRTRDQLRDCFTCYEQLRTRLRNEDQTRQNEGIVTLGRGRFANETERQAFLATEERMHAWMAPVVDAMRNGSVHVFDTLLDGSSIPEQARIGIDFAALLAGVDPRRLYFKTFVDPFTARRVLGVTALDQLTNAMASFGGTIASIGGVAPDRGSLQEFPGYALRRTLTQIPSSTKLIDGNFGDWDRDRDQIMLQTRTQLFESRPELGQVFVARDAADLFVFLDTDLTAILTDPTDDYSIDVEWDNGVMQQVRFQNQVHGTTGQVRFQHRAGGIECAFPHAGTQAKIRVRVRAQNTIYDFESERGPVIVDAR